MSTTPSPAVIAARARTFDELFAATRAVSRRMVIFAFLGLLLAGAMLLGAYLIVQAGGNKGYVPATVIAIVALAIAASSFFLRRAADRYDDAHARRSIASLVEGVALETAYWRTTAITTLVMAAAIVLPAIFMRMARDLGGSPEVRTVNDMRVIAAALETYAKEHHAYPNATTADALAGVLRPYLPAAMPQRDGWRRPFEYTPICAEQRCFDYRLVSLGKNGVTDVNVASLDASAQYICFQCPVEPLDLEIVHGSGRFLLMPAALRQPND